MAQKKNVYEGYVNELLTNDIIINVNHLKQGYYTLVIMHKNKIIKKTRFKK
ncbi:MAG: hypothetical protein HKO72_06560 [Flavobacteriaceae bacterium]|nr:hypothetical protein [Bacteroidia bacterium]NNL60984.1 hypothetical protein [Flavobacteriaceae bacterium]